MKSKLITCRVNPTDKKLLDKYAQAKNKTTSDILRRIISAFLVKKGLL